MEYPNLKDVSMTNNRLNSDAFKTVCKLPRLEVLDLSENDIGDVHWKPDDFSTYPNTPTAATQFRKLVLARNKISTISLYGASPLERLTHLDLSGTVSGCVYFGHVSLTSVFW